MFEKNQVILIGDRTVQIKVLDMNPFYLKLADFSWVLSGD